MSRTIHLNPLDPASVQQALRELDDYRRLVESKCEELRQRVASLIATNARDIFNSAVADDLINDGVVIGSVSVDVQNNGNVTLVIASGEDAVFMEFGAGVYYNGSVGSSPNPLGAGLGYTIGSYGLGNGAKNVWGFKDEDGEFHLTHGTPASMPMYRSMMAVVNNIEQIAREVFRT